jgi:recombination protein U
MAINYPNGQQFNRLHNLSSTKNHTNENNHISIYGKRGMSLEEEINESNQYYLQHEIAVIHKKPTPIQLVKVDYPKRSAAVIKEAYFRKPSTTDYNGIYRGYYIDFDAKETRNKSSFPLKNFHQHQIDHLNACLKQGGICFAFLKFTQKNEIYLLPASILITCWNQQETGGRKSISYQTIVDQGYSVQYHLNPLLPYLDAVDKMILASNEE